MRKSRSTFTADAQSLIAQTWRPAAELPACLAWIGATLYALAAGLPAAVSRPMAIVCMIMAFRRFLSLREVLRARSLLAGRPVAFHTSDLLASRVKNEFKRRGVVWFGEGFDWTPEHSQKLYELSRVDIKQLLPPAWVRRYFVKGTPPVEGAIGLAAIEGLEDRTGDITMPQKTLEGGTLIVGTTQAGKGVLLTNLVTQAIVRGETVIILDPKMSSRLMNATVEACRIAGRSAPAFFHPSGASRIRLNPLANFERTSELASRITAVMNEDGPFTAFAWSAVNTVCALLLDCGKSPTIALIESALSGGLPTLIREALERHWGTDAVEFAMNDAHSRGLRGRDQLLAVLVDWRQSPQYRPGRAPALEAAAAVYEHDPVHYAKITASLMPVLGMLTSGSLRQSLSPDPQDRTDRRPIASLSAILETRGVLYVCLNSLPDPTVAAAIGSILLADLASCAGARYNDPGKTRGVVSLFVDECSNVINKPLIEILNKGAESGIRTTAAMQTVSDLAARLGSNEAARMALGNFNTLVSLRTKDRVTQDFVTETFGRTYIANQGASLTTGASSAAAGDFTAAYTRQVTGVRDDLIPVDILGKLPNCEFFASVAGGRIVKGRIPILTCTGALERTEGEILGINKESQEVGAVRAKADESKTNDGKDQTAGRNGGRVGVASEEKKED